MPRTRGVRRLLNPPGFDSTAAIVAEVEDTRNWQTGRYRNGTPLDLDDETQWQLTPAATLQISDCSRSLVFTLHWDTAAGRRASLAKVDALVGALGEFRTALVEEQKLYVARLRRARLAGPAKKKPE